MNLYNSSHKQIQTCYPLLENIRAVISVILKPFKERMSSFLFPILTQEIFLSDALCCILMETTKRFHLPWAFLPVSVGYPDSCAEWWAMLFLRSLPFFPPPPPLLSTPNSWVALSWQDKCRVLTPFPLILLLPNGNILRLMKSFMIFSGYWLMQKVNEWRKCTLWTSWCVSGPWLRRTGSFLRLLGFPSNRLESQSS